MNALTFGVNPYDQCPTQTGRYHVIDEAGYIRAKTNHGFSAYDQAGNLSAGEANIIFKVIDTRDGSIYGSYHNGEEGE